MDKDWDTSTWIDAKTLPDEAWSEAWRAVDEPLRARLKTALAALCQVYAPAAPPSERQERIVRQGLVLTRTSRPLDWALVLFDGECSAAQVLAAAAPARLMGVPRVMAARIDGDFPDDVLCGLELAGVEEAYALSADEGARLAGHLFATGPGILLGVGDSNGLDKGLSAAPRDSVWQGRAPDGALPAGLHLGPGQEGVWGWPGLGPERFLSVSWALEAQEPKQEE